MYECFVVCTWVFRMSTELRRLYIQWYCRSGRVFALWFQIRETTHWWTVLWQVFCLSINQEKLLQSCTVFRFLRLLNDESPLPTFTVNGCFFTTCADFAGLTCTWSRPSIFSRIEPALQRLDWHSVHFKIIFEIAILMYLYKNCSTSSLSSEPSTPRTHHVQRSWLYSWHCLRATTTRAAVIQHRHNSIRALFILWPCRAPPRVPPKDFCRFRWLRSSRRPYTEF